MSNSKHVPMRMCAVTRAKMPKNELLRFVATPQGIVLDKGEKIRGRGLNMTPSLEVFDQGVVKKVFDRFLNYKIDNDKLANLRKEVEDYLNLKFKTTQVVRVSQENLDKLSRQDNGN